MILKADKTVKFGLSNGVSCSYEDGVLIADVDYIKKSVFDNLPKRARTLLKEAGFKIIDPINRIVIE